MGHKNARNGRTDGLTFNAAYSGNEL